MLNSKPINKIIWFDIESVPEKESFFELTPKKQDLFKQKFRKEWEELGLGPEANYKKEVLTSKTPEYQEEQRGVIETLYQNKAALFAEFGKVVCISIGFIDDKFPLPEDLKDLAADTEIPLKMKTFSGDNEKDVLKGFYGATHSILDKPHNPSYHLCGHNILNFDIPFLAKRFIINGLPLPGMLDLDGKKEWNLPYLICTRRVWGMSVYDGGCSLDLLCEILGVASPKDGGISGKDVRNVYYIDKDTQRIADYCSLDVSQLATCYLRMKSIPNKVVIIK